MAILKIKATEFKKMKSPVQDVNKVKYLCYVNINDVPDNIPMLTNPRDQKLGGGVAKDIDDSLVSNDGQFHLKNRGIVISAAKVTYDTSTKIMSLILDDPYEHGNIDGGHTYKICLNNQGKGLEQYVQFEIMVGVEDIIEPLAEARNTSSQVDQKSLAELANRFEPIKAAIEGLPFYNRIAFKQNQQFQINGKKVKMIDAREIVAIISMFDKEKYSFDNHPTHAYSSKAKVLSDYLNDPEHFEKFSNIASDIFDLYDEIEGDFAYSYNKSGGRYGGKRYSGYKEKDGIAVEITKSKFSLEPLNYRIPDGLIYPLISSFRALVAYNKETEKYFWRKDPLDVYNDIKVNIVSKIMKNTDSLGNNPNATGKNTNAWDLLYMTVERELI